MKQLNEAPLSNPAPSSVAHSKIVGVPQGRTLDALVAQHIFGWRWIANIDIHHPQWSCTRIVSEHWEKMAHTDVTDREDRPPLASNWDSALPAYSTSGAALEVLAAMNDRNFQYQILKTPKQCHMVSFTSRSGTADESAFADSLPEAICHAALTAVLRDQANAVKEHA